MLILIDKQLEKKQEKKTLDYLLEKLGDTFYLVTQKKEVTREECISFVTTARSKNMNDFNIAGLIRTEQGFLSALMK